jgi:hypothetical protein
MEIPDVSVIGEAVKLNSSSDRRARYFFIGTDRASSASYHSFIDSNVGGGGTRYTFELFRSLIQNRAVPVGVFLRVSKAGHMEVSFEAGVSLI